MGSKVEYSYEPCQLNRWRPLCCVTLPYWLGLNRVTALDFWVSVMLRFGNIGWFLSDPGTNDDHLFDFHFVVWLRPPCSFFTKLCFCCVCKVLSQRYVLTFSWVLVYSCKHHSPLVVHEWVKGMNCIHPTLLRSEGPPTAVCLGEEYCVILFFCLFRFLP